MKWQTYIFDGGYLAVCTARDLGWKRVHGIVHKRSFGLLRDGSPSGKVWLRIGKGIAPGQPPALVDQDG